MWPFVAVERASRMKTAVAVHQIADLQFVGMGFAAARLRRRRIGVLRIAVRAARA